jgi:hypothetical protein
MLTRALVVALAVVLSGCTAEVEERYTNKLVSCSVSVPQDWWDALERNQVRKDSRENAVAVVAASADGRTTVVQTWSSEVRLALHNEHGLRLPIASARGYLNVVEFDGRKVTFTVNGPGEEASFYTWDAQMGGSPVQVDAKFPEPEHYRSSDGTTTVSTEDHRLYAQRAGWPQPRLISEIQKSHQVGRISAPKVHGDFVSWFGMDSSYITDIRTGASVHTAKPRTLRVIGGALVMLGHDVTSATPLSGLSPLPKC